ncbi:DUF5677 domain-containing protein [Terribacillus sp. JSM ZJ617]|uniref:DUF5677 domain-containing protein n=1 Tax=Terribacillus sp. JSM ZJ617 TaxID=3342119 RepID=UPI0035A9A54D
MDNFEILNEVLTFGKKTFHEYKESHDYRATKDKVVLGLFRKIIELAEGVYVTSLDGLNGPASINVRGMIEAYLAYRYIFEKDSLIQKRTEAYVVGYYLTQIQASEFNFDSYDDKTKKHIEKSIEYLKKQLSKTEFTDTYNLYKKEIEKLPDYKKNQIPKWYSLARGPKSVNALAKHLEDDSDPTTARLYSFLSSSAHMYMTLSDFNGEGEDWIIKDVNQQQVMMETWLLLSRSLLLTTIEHFIQNRTPSGMSEYNDLISKIKPHIRY